MEVMIHFVFELIKIFILATAYATVLLLLFRLQARFLPNGWCDQVSKVKIRFWFVSGFLISVSLFVFLFSYYGNHGLGDGPRVPVGHGLVVNNANWTEYGYIEDIKTSDGHGLEMTKFLAVDDHLMGNLDSWFDTYMNSFFIYDMDRRTMNEFSTETEFNAYATAHGLPEVNALRTFERNYDDRWGGWWFWLLP
jgi:hypothetical protein